MKTLIGILLPILMTTTLMSQPVMTVWEVMEDHKHLDAHNVIEHPNLISWKDE
ncbi:MAG: hypothetical protein P8M34_14340 [Saprospiraceae bacterium]|nr:hypothetical protein [Saprospiraceae bacterium]|tara:strand:- start:848 stop:1006 length:159 start_codon:yes stop_codon:yes gene_type:complete